MSRIPALISTLWLGFVALGHAQLQPQVSNIQAAQRPDTKLVDISYDIAYSDGPVTIWIDVSNDGGRSFIVPAKTFSGHIGQNIQPGNNRAVVWNAEADFDGMLAEQMRVRVNARGGNVPVPPSNMVYIPGGYFYMGNWDGGSSVSARQVYISPVFVDRYEVWGTFYQEVRDWGEANGYSMRVGSSNAGGHPIHSISWYDAVKWCNARSEREGLTPVYYTDTTHTTVYRSGDVDLTNAMAKWNSNGYRLPTEAEWEKAARGGLVGKEYPWGNIIDQSMANYDNLSSGVNTTPVGFFNGWQLEGASDMANGYGLYDMAGNVAEWCWDRWTDNPAGDQNPRGPDTGIYRLYRDGSWLVPASNVRCAYRASESPESTVYYYSVPGRGYNVPLGFRCARGL